MGKAKENTEETKSNLSWIAKIKNAFTKEPVQVCMGVVIIILDLFLIISSLSFLWTGWEDQSLLKGDYPPEYLSQNIQNWAGLMGAKVSDFLINRTFGLPVAFYLFYLLLIGLWMVNIRPMKGNMQRVFFICSFGMLWGSIFLGSFADCYESTFLFLGGEHGYQVNLLFRAHIGWVGIVLFLLLTFLLFSFYAFDGVYDKFVSCAGKFSNAKKDIASDPSLAMDAEQQTQSTETNELIGQSVENQQQLDAEMDEKKENSSENMSETQETNSHLTSTSQVEKEESSEIGEQSSTMVHQTVDDSQSTHPELEPDDYVLPSAPETLVENSENGTQMTTIKGESSDGVDFQIEQTKEEMVDDSQVSELYDPTKDLEFYKRPTLDLFDQHEINQEVDIEEQNKNKARIVELLHNFRVEISSIKATVGPTVTLYEVTPAPGVRITTIRSLAQDIALGIAANGIRIIAPMPGKGTIGIEVPNAKAQIVPMSEIIGSKKFQESKFELPIALGKTITNEVFMLDLCKMPHVLVAGATGQGKSVGLNAIITSLLYKKHPSELKFVMVDPKMVEFSMYAPIERHFLAKMPDATDAIITDVKKVVQTLNSLCVEMDNRYELLKDAKVRQVKEYNEKFINRKLNPNNGHHYMPYIVVVIDEFADLIMQVGKDVETPLARIGQKARAVGIHVILATQRPSANIITGVIKANFPARFAFRVSTGLESRVILDTMGAEQLIGRGDMLISQGNDLNRVQCALVDTPEVERIAKHISEQQGYPTAFILPEYVEESENGGEGRPDVDLSKKDPMFAEAAQLVVATQQGSTSMIQRKFSIGYNRAGRIMDQLEAANIVGPAEGSKPRQVLVTDMGQLDSMLSCL